MLIFDVKEKSHGIELRYFLCLILRLQVLSVNCNIDSINHFGYFFKSGFWLSVEDLILGMT